MAVDTPASFVIAGFTPLALETALYARFLGYQVTLIGTGDVCEEVRKFPPEQVEFSNVVTALGLKAIAAQNVGLEVDALKQIIRTDHDWWTHYLEPLAASDLLIDSFAHVEQIQSARLIDQANGDSIEKEADGDDQNGDDQDEFCTMVFELEYLPVDADSNEQVAKTEKLIADVLIDLQEIGQQPFFDFARELQVETDAATGIAGNLQAWINDPSSFPNHRDRLLTSVDDFYRLGRISFGQDVETSNQHASSYSYRDGIEQIRDLFQIIGDRETLDLYG